MKGKSGVAVARFTAQWRVVFRWSRGNDFEVQVIDYH